MFPEMRRSAQRLTETQSISILKSATSGVLALTGDDDYPYAVPLSHVYHNGKLYFHGAMDGHKARSVRRSPKASFCVIDADDVIPQRFTTHYRSVIVFGRVREVTDPQEKLEAITALAMRYGAAHMDRGEEEIRTEWDRLMMIALDMEHITGKESRELMESRR